MKMADLDYFMAIRPLIRPSECGDTGFIQEFENKVFIGIIDVLGHGAEAFEIAKIGTNFLENSYHQDLIEIMKRLHERLKGSRGAVASFCLLDKRTGVLKHVGIGDITVRKFGTNTKQMIPRSGVVGYAIPTPKEETMELADGDVLVLHTDGVKTHFGLEDYPGLFNENAKTIARNIIKKFGKKEDDAGCIVLKYDRTVTKKRQQTKKNVNF